MEIEGGGSSSPLELEVRRRHDNDQLSRPLGKELARGGEREGRLSRAGRRDREEVSLAAGRKPVEGRALPGSQSNRSGHLLPSSCQRSVGTSASLPARCLRLRPLAGIDRKLVLAPAAQPRSRYFKMLTARATTSATVTNEIADCTSMIAFAQRDNGMTSVGLNAVAFVNEVYR